MGGGHPGLSFSPKPFILYVGSGNHPSVLPDPQTPNVGMLPLKPKVLNRDSNRGPYCNPYQALFGQGEHPNPEALTHEATKRRQMALARAGIEVEGS